MPGTIRRWSLGAIGLLTLAVMPVLAAEPIKPPLLPAPISQPPGEPPTWTPSRKAPVVPAAMPVPRIELPKSSHAPVVIEEAPAPRLKVAPRLSIEVAPPARPVQSADPVRPAPVTLPGFNLRPPEPRHNVNPSGSPAPPAPELLPPPKFTESGGLPAVSATPMPAPGDTPMPAMSTRQTVLSAMFGVALAAAPLSPAVAQDKDKDDKKTQPDLTAIKTDLEQIKKDVEKLQTFRKNMDDAVYGKENSTALADMGLIRRLTEIESQINRINETLKQINAKLGEPGKSTTSAFGPPAPTTTTTGRGFVRIVNDYPTEMSMIINGRSHRVPAGQSVTVDVPPGNFTYELLHAGSSQTNTTVKEGETMTLRIR